MKPCPYCAETINDDAIKCRFCQSLLGPSTGGSAGPPREPCPYCEREVPGHTSVCGHCGARIRGGARGPVLRFLVALVGGAAIVGAIAFFADWAVFRGVVPPDIAAVDAGPAKTPHAGARGVKPGAGSKPDAASPERLLPVTPVREKPREGEAPARKPLEELIPRRDRPLAPT